MGTLFEQRPRDIYDGDFNSIIGEIDQIEEIALETDLTYDQVLATLNMLEMRRKNHLYRANGDAFDEQMAGFGELINEFLSLYLSFIIITRDE